VEADKRGDGPTIFNAEFRHGTPVELAARSIVARHPDFVGIGCYIWNHRASVALARRLRELIPDVTIIVGGPNVSPDSPELVELAEAGHVDYFVQGDGENIFLRLISGSAEPVPFQENEGLFLPIVKRVDSRPSQRWLSGLVPDLDVLPNPYRTIPRMMVALRRSGVGLVEGSRGCVFSCAFCDQGWRKVRMRDLDLVKNDIKFLYDNGARRIIFLDPTFNFQRERARAILGFISDQLPGLAIHAEVKADILGPDEIEHLASLPTTTVEVGLQTSNLATLKSIGRPTKLDKLQNSVGELVDREVHVCINTIVALPGESMQDWFETLDFCYRLGRVEITAAILRVLPNTELFASQADSQYEYDDGNTYRVTKSKDMSETDLVVAMKMITELTEAQKQSTFLDHLRSEIDCGFHGSLAAYLYDRATVADAHLV
jgi:radical SAM superfamily enzyme YgiQ (UPF0313 family)